MKREYKYQTNCTIRLERQADYKTLEKIKTKFIAARGVDELDGFSGNLAMHIKMNVKTKRFKATKDWSSSDDTHASLYEVMPAALALYRLCAFDEVEVKAFGQDGYKCVWQVALIHVPSRRLIVFGEHKGALSLWTDRHGSEIKEDKELVKDLCEFLTYLASDKFAHPYDGLVAGSVA